MCRVVPHPEAGTPASLTLLACHKLWQAGLLYGHFVGCGLLVAEHIIFPLSTA